MIADLVRDGDRDRFWCVQFAPPAARPAMLAVLAFALEVEAVPSRTTREPMMGALRFAWWREGLDAIFANGHLPPHPVLDAIAAAVREHGIVREPLDQLIDAAETAASGDAVDLYALQARCATEGAAPLTLWLRILDAETRATQAAVTAAGTAWALTRHAHARADREALLALVAEAIARARTQRNDVLDAAIPALLPLSLAARSLRLLRKGRDPNGDNRVFRQLSLLPRAVFSRY